MSKSSTSWRTYLSQFTVKDLLPSNFKLHYVTNQDKLVDVLRILTTYRINSVPVKDVNTNAYTGFISMLDLVAVVVFLSDCKPIADAVATYEIEWKKFLAQEQKVIHEQIVDGMSNASEREPWCPVYEGFPLLSLMDMFSKDVNLHHVAVSNGDGQITGFISQSRVLEFLAKNLHQFNQIGSMKLKDAVQYPPSKVISVSINDRAIDAFRKMIQEKVAGVAVVDADNKLVGSISASDLKGSLEENIFVDLYLPVYMYLEKCTKAFQRNSSLAPVCCTGEDTIHTILDKLNSKHIHRLFVVNENNIPVRVLSLCDIISILDR